MSHKRIFLFLSTILLWTGATARAQLSPSATTLGPSQQQQFSLGGQQATMWEVAPPGSGSITSNGLYTAPPTYHGSYAYVYARVGEYSYQAQVYLSPAQLAGAGSSGPAPTSVSVSISPSTVFLHAGQTEQFIATVTGTSNSQVTWSLTGGVGYIASGIYHAPSSV